MGRSYFLFCVRVDFAGAARFARDLLAGAGALAALRRRGSAARFADGFGVDGRAVLGGRPFVAAGRGTSAARRGYGAGAGARWTRVNRVWSPMVW
jgi:hypothetical protein